MAYQRAEAIDLTYMQAETAYPAREAQPSFEVIEGGGLDALARRGVDAAFMARVWTCVAAVLVVVAIGVIRVSLSTATVSRLEEVGTLRSQVSDLEDLNARLEVERSIEASSQRIVAIATQAYGMEYASDVDTLRLSLAVEQSEDGEAIDADVIDTVQDGDEQAQSSVDMGEGVSQGETLASGMPVVAAVEVTSEDGR